jgi:hypothetical protein
MQEKHLFEYAVIRIVPQVEREEFVNAGVIVYCPAKSFLQTRFALPLNKLLVFSCEKYMAELKKRLQAFEQICAGSKEGGPIGKFPLAARFRWLTANRSTIIQTSPVHTGLCIDPFETLTRLHSQLVE